MALRTLAVAAQVGPGINAGPVPVIPVETDGIIAHLLDRLDLQGRPIDAHRRRRLYMRLSGLAAFRLANTVAVSAGACVAQPAEAPFALVPVLPVDFHSIAGSFVHANVLGFCRFAR